MKPTLRALVTAPLLALAACGSLGRNEQEQNRAFQNLYWRITDGEVTLDKARRRAEIIINGPTLQEQEGHYTFSLGTHTQNGTLTKEEVPGLGEAYRFEIQEGNPRIVMEYLLGEEGIKRVKLQALPYSHETPFSRTNSQSTAIGGAMDFFESPPTYRPKHLQLIPKDIGTETPFPLWDKGCYLGNDAYFSLQKPNAWETLEEKLPALLE